MSAIAERQAGATGRARDRGASTVWSLARVEGRRLLRGPAFLIGLVFSVVLIILSGELAWGFTSYELLTGIALVPLASGTLIGVYLAGTRPARHGTTELYAATPTRAEVSTWAGLVSLAWPVAVAGVVVAVAASFDGVAATSALLALFGAAWLLPEGLSLFDDGAAARRRWWLVVALGVAGFLYGSRDPGRRRLGARIRPSPQLSASTKEGAGQPSR